jgi:hypothetical protein
VGIVILYYIGGLAAVRRTRYHIDTHGRRYPYARGYAQRGVLSFTSGSTVTITITNKPSREVGSAYFTISAPTQDPTLPLYFVGSTFVPTNVGGIEVDTAGNHWACVIPSGGGTSSLTWTTAVTIPLGGVYIQGTGGIGATIS